MQILTEICDRNFVFDNLSPSVLAATEANEERINPEKLASIARNSSKRITSYFWADFIHVLQKVCESPIGLEYINIK